MSLISKIWKVAMNTAIQLGPLCRSQVIFNDIYTALGPT